jgi:tetratricopeptide (TPR) repeat protein
VKVVDEHPGTDAAKAAVDVVEDAGWPKDKVDAPFWRFVQSRHHLVAKETSAARKALADGFRLANPDQEGLSEGVGALLRWMAVEKHYRILDDALQMARRGRLTRTRQLASVASIVGDDGQHSRARAILASARALGPESPDDWIALADAYARIDDAKSAQQCLDRAGPRETWGGDPWMVVGRIESSRKHYREAVAAYEKAMELSDERRPPLYFRGLSLLMLGDPEGAEADFRTSIELGNDGSQVLGALGYALFDQSRLDDAEDAFRQALALDEAAPDNHIGLAMTLLRADRTDDAMASYARALALDRDFEKGLRLLERKGFVYSDVQAKAWEDLRARHRKVRKP